MGSATTPGRKVRRFCLAGKSTGKRAGTGWSVSSAATALDHGEDLLTTGAMDTAGYTIGSARYGGTRHPFRASLPRRVLRSLPEHEPEVAARLAAVSDVSLEPEAKPRRSLAITAQDVKDFLLAYTACLLAAMTFLG